jgi:AbrB family looped-hinge helix DNA binding protein
MADGRCRTTHVLAAHISSGGPFPLGTKSVTRVYLCHGSGGDMELQARLKVGEKGRLVIPAAMREALGIDVGASVDLRVVDGELRVSTIRSRVLRVQERARRYVKPGTLVSDELSAERREAEKHE